MPTTGTPFSAKIRAVWIPGRQSKPMITAGARWHCARRKPGVAVSLIVLIGGGNLGESDPLRSDMWKPPACRLMRRDGPRQVAGRADIATPRPQAPQHFGGGRFP